MISPAMWWSAQVGHLLSSSAPPAPAGAAVPGPCIMHKRGNDILHDPWYKDTAFPITERDRLGIRGLLPPRVMSFEQQYEGFINSLQSLENTRASRTPSSRWPNVGSSTCCTTGMRRDLGLRQPRLEGEEYLDVVDEFMEAVHAHWPKAAVLPLLGPMQEGRRQWKN